MIRLRAAFLVVLLSCFSWASNTAHAGPTSNYNDFTWNNDIDYYADTYLEANTDAVMTDWHWMLAGDPNNGDTTDDGFCFMFYNGGDPYAIYNNIQPSQCAFYNSGTYAGAEWISFMDINLIQEPDPAPMGIYQDQQSFVGVVDDETNIFGNGSAYWSGCFATGDSPTWADGQGAGGGECPIINNGSGQINWGYVEQTLTQISAIDTALKNAGLETYGYTYSWMVKNADANFESTNGALGQDTLTVTLSVKDNGGNIVYEKEFDYSYWIDNWTQFSGEENFDRPFDLNSIDAIMLQVKGQDVGDWEGWYGPEFNNPNVILKYRPIIEDNTEEMLLEQMCQNDPLYDMSCPGYQNAMLEQMNAQTNIESLGTVGPTETVANDGSINVEAVVQETAPIQEVVNEQVAEVAEEATQETGTEEVQESGEAEVANDPASSEEKKGTGLNADQLMALDIAENATAAAESTASAAATQSAGIGLSESGGVASDLTSDGVSNADGTLNSSVASMTNGSGSGDSMGMTDMSMGGNDQGSGMDGDISLGGLPTDLQTTGNSFSNDLQNELDTQAGVDLAEMNTNNENNQMMNDMVGNTALEFEMDMPETNNQNDFGNEQFEMAALDVEDLSSLDVSNPIIDNIINGITNDIIQQAALLAEEVAEEASEESYEEQNAKEDELVAAAQNGDDSEDAQAALLGYNPEFRAYQAPQLPDTEFYDPKVIYDEQKNYDNPDARFFNGASDARHREMVRQQYER